MGRVFRVVGYVLAVSLALLVLLVGGAWLISEGVGGELHPRGPVTAEAIPAAAVADRREQSAGGKTGSQILFGDLHVHTTFSADAFVFSLPLFQGEGVHPPADACDFARFCGELDFFSLNDHAEFLTPRQWEESRKSIRECNAVAGNEEDPDLVAFLGWEWTQSSSQFNPKDAHYGHKNVILLGTEDDEVPARPIGAGTGGLFAVNLPGPVWAAVRAGMTLFDLPAIGPYLDFNRWVRELRDSPECPEGVPVRELPADCIEGAPTPDVLFDKLDDWGFESLVIPHGTAWGIHAPYGASLAAQLPPGLHDPRRQRLFEVYSGHGNSERYAEMVEYTIDEDGERVCAPPREGYLPCCWRAGEIVYEQCTVEGRGEEECRDRAALARKYMAAADGGKRYEVVPGASAADWLECGQLPDGFLPAYEYRPKMSAQFGLAIRAPDGRGGMTALRYGLIGSSDNHKARAGPGYKELGRKAFGDAYGPSKSWAGLLDPETPLTSDPVPPEELQPGVGTDRNASYYYTAGLVAVHADGRDRQNIWDALAARRTYGTSGDRILLWFDLLNGPGGTEAPMGAEVALGETPRFRVRALGAFEQKPGCPEHTRRRLAPERLARLCLNECYHPSDVRKRIEAIEVVRIRPQRTPDEPVAPLIEDPWRTFACPADVEGCTVEFEDPEFVEGAREALYYVRALQEPTPAVNGDPMRCERDAAGACLAARPCPAAGPEFDPSDDCLSPVRERAWSSPIWVLPGTRPGPEAAAHDPGAVVRRAASEGLPRVRVLQSEGGATRAGVRERS